MVLDDAAVQPVAGVQVTADGDARPAPHGHADVDRVAALAAADDGRDDVGGNGAPPGFAVEKEADAPMVASIYLRVNVVFL